MLVNLTGWYMHSSQEFVYVGDEAIVEPSGRSRRFGIDVGLRYNFLRDFYFRTDYTWCHARSIDEPKGEDYIPLAPVHTLTAGLTWKKNGFNAGVNCRWLSDRPANEDYSLTAQGYFIVDLNASYTYRRVTFGAAIDNLFDRKWREAQFATETMIPGDTEPVTDICFTRHTLLATRVCELPFLIEKKHGPALHEKCVRGGTAFFGQPCAAVIPRRFQLRRQERFRSVSRSEPQGHNCGVR